MKSLCLLMLFSGTLAAAPSLSPRVPELSAVSNDLQMIVKNAHLPLEIEINLKELIGNSSVVRCSGKKITIEVPSGENWGQIFYMTLQRMGFLFPHPRLQISPDQHQIKKTCNQTFTWRPAVKYHGFHLHTLHPNEWMEGFLMGKTQIALDTVRWFARNQQNIFDLSLLRMDDDEIFKNLKEPFALARSLGIHTGITAGMAFHQQKSYKFIPLYATFFDGWSLEHLEEKLELMLKNLDLSFLNLESGTSEFTPASYPRSILWMNKAAEVAKKHAAAVVIKIHASSNQKDETYGNYNFLPAKAHPDVGILPHTVFLYGLNDELAPMYGNKNFHEIRDFMVQEKEKRRTWFYPETSYYLGLDIDIPLLLTDYLLTRANDTKFLFEQKIEGQLNFSTGHEVGYWLYDWSYTLFNNLDYAFDPLIGLTLLGEDRKSWQDIVDFQHEVFINQGLISIISFPSLGDELMPGLHQVLKRNLLSTLNENPQLLKAEIELLKSAVPLIPTKGEIKNDELRALWNLTSLRIPHALFNRLALLEPLKRDFYLRESSTIRQEAMENMNFILKHHQRYPEAQLFEEYTNPTAYQFGYLFSTKELYYWRREEEQIKQNNFSWTFMKLHSYWGLIRGWVLSR